MRDRTENQIELVFIRHAATKSNKEHRYVGKTDEPLSGEGIDTLLELKRGGIYPKADIVFSSPMKRCIETARLIYPLNTPIVVPEWREMDFGEFEGKNYADLKNDRRYQEWIDSYASLPFPNGESREDFARRCDTGFQKILELMTLMSEKDRRRSKTVCAVVHGGTIMALLSRYGGGGYFDYQVSNCEGYRCLVRNDAQITDIEKI